MKQTEYLIPHNIEELNRLLSYPQMNNKSEWPPQAKLNCNIKKVVWSEDKGCYVHLCFTDSNYIKFMDTYLKTKVGIQMQHICMYYDEIIHIPTDVKNEKLLKIKLFTDNLLRLITDDYELMFVPYNKGVMLNSIIVNENKRGKGLATELVNELYDLSEELNIPLYLQPYPDGDSIEINTIWPKINQLRNWYDKLGFGPIYEGSLVWSNFTEEAIEEIFLEDYIEKKKRAERLKVA